MKWYRDDEKRGNVYKTYADGSNESFAYQAGPNYIRDYLNKITSTNAPEIEIIQAVSKYLKDNPLCCQILKPDHLGNQVWNGDGFMADQRYIDAYEWGYVADVYIFNKRPFYKIDTAFNIKDLYLEWDGTAGKGMGQRGWPYMMNNCGEVKNFDVG